MSKLFSYLLFFLFANFSYAETSVNSSVDRNVMGKGDTFTLSITVSSENSVNVQQPQLPTIENFDIINTWTSSESRSTFANGKFQVERKQIFNYMLAPQKEGKFTIDSAKVQIDDQVFVTKPINLTVVAGTVEPPPNKKQSPSPFDDVDDIFSQFLRRRPRPGFRSAPVDPKDAFFIQVEVDKTDVYAGEQVTASFYLYSRAQITDIDTLKYPSLNGFWKEDIQVATRLGFQDEIVNGIAYRKALLASYALFPIKPGKINVDSYKARCTVVSPSALGFGQPVQLTKESKIVEVNVKSLPSSNDTTPFVGGVGEFQVSSQIDSNSVPANQPLTWKVRFSGRGNAKLIDLPKLTLPEGLELYDTKSDSKFNKNGTSFKEFEILIIPRKSGNYSIPSIAMRLFNPETSSYYTVNTDELNFEVQATQGEKVIPAIPLADTEKPEAIGSEIPQLLLQTRTSTFHLSHNQVFSIWGGLYLFVFMFLSWQGYLTLGNHHRKKDIESILKSKFNKIHDLQDKNAWRAVGVEVMNTFYFLIGEISGQGGANQEIEKLILKVPPSVRREVGEELLKFLKIFEVLSFAPEAAVGALKEKSHLKKNVSEMEKVLLKAVSLGLGKQINE